MRWQDAAVVGTTAAVTALAVLAVGWTGLAVATEGHALEVQWPVLREGGCEITLQADKGAYQGGDSPVVKLLAANPGPSPVSLEATLRMMAQPKGNDFSRRMPVAAKSWEHKCTISLDAGEKKTLSIPTEVKAAGGPDALPLPPGGQGEREHAAPRRGWAGGQRGHESAARSSGDGGADAQERRAMMDRRKALGVLIGGAVGAVGLSLRDRFRLHGRPGTPGRSCPTATAPSVSW